MWYISPKKNKAVRFENKIGSCLSDYLTTDSSSIKHIQLLLLSNSLGALHFSSSFSRNNNFFLTSQSHFYASQINLRLWMFSLQQLEFNLKLTLGNFIFLNFLQERRITAGWIRIISAKRLMSGRENPLEVHYSSTFLSTLYLDQFIIFLI